MPPVDKTFPKTQRFLGLWNTSQSRRQPRGEDGRAITLSSAINVDIDDEGGILSRPGFSATSVTATSVTAAYFRRDYQVGYIVDNGVLKRISSGLDVSELGPVSTETTYWQEVGNRVFLSTGYVVEGDTVLNWRIQPPETPEILVTGGNLSAGIYQIVTTRITVDGAESGSSVPQMINVPENGGIKLFGVSGCNVYVTLMNGADFYLAGYETALITEVDGFVYYPMPEDLLMAAALPDNVGPIAYYNSCMYYSEYDSSKHETKIGWSSPFWWHLFDMRDDYFQIAGEVRLLVGLDEGLLIGTDKEILLYTDEEGPVKQAQYGVPKGQIYVYNRDKKIFFQSMRGICTMPFQNLTGDKVALPLGDFCTLGWIDMNGLEKVITLTDGTGRTDNSTIF